jgi:hypothetical protein
MIFGISTCKKYTDYKERKETYAAIQKFTEKFREIHGILNCRSLINCDLRTEEGHRYLKVHKLRETVCEKCIINAIKNTKEIIKQ